MKILKKNFLSFTTFTIIKKIGSQPFKNMRKHSRKKYCTLQTN